MSLRICNPHNTTKLQTRKDKTMTAIQLQAEYQDLVSIIAQKDYETISKAVKALKNILYPPTTQKTISKADLVIDPRIAAMTKGIIPPDSYDYKEQRYSEYMKGE